MTKKVIDFNFPKISTWQNGAKLIKEIREIGKTIDQNRIPQRFKQRYQKIRDHLKKIHILPAKNSD